MKFLKASLPGTYVIDPSPFLDERGYFARIFCQKEFVETGFEKQIVQINHSLTRQRGTVRGMHYQIPPACETKIIRCVQGKVFDVMVDLRAGSSTFLQWQGVALSAENMRMILIPEGYAHGFQTLTDNVELIYHHSAFYSPDHERGFRFDDPALSIDWPLSVSAISPKDQGFQFIGDDFKGIEI